MLSIISSVLFIPIFGTIGAGISTAVGFGSMLILRLFDTRKIIKIDLSYKNFILNNVLIIIQVVCLYSFNAILLYILQCVIMFCIIAINRGLIVKTVKNLLASLT